MNDSPNIVITAKQLTSLSEQKYSPKQYIPAQKYQHRFLWQRRKQARFESYTFEEDADSDVGPKMMRTSAPARVTAVHNKYASQLSSF